MAQLGLTDHELHAWRTFFRMVLLLPARLERQLQAGSGLSNADYMVLVLLAEAPGRRMRSYELGRTAGWEKSRMHHQLTRMSRRGLVTREPCGSRGIYAVLTDEGFAALKKAVPGHGKEIRRLFIDRLTPEELDRFAGLAAKILDGLDADQPPPE
ncbi:MarR family winged helix-turn-helix transcriptional regulator [Spongiactinospora sp. 9N601]|uniref:MarR family winged helix-turn-helix transcriptional regulator n=1 Tax=Spongiactinospora sp. 9N601 TaxID=3375149 RepID=UPI0037BDE715